MRIYRFLLFIGFRFNLYYMTHDDHKTFNHASLLGLAIKRTVIILDSKIRETNKTVDSRR